MFSALWGIVLSLGSFVSAFLYIDHNVSFDCTDAGIYITEDDINIDLGIFPNTIVPPIVALPYDNIEATSAKSQISQR